MEQKDGQLKSFELVSISGENKWNTDYLLLLQAKNSNYQK